MAEPSKKNEERDIFIGSAIYPDAAAVFQFRPKSLTEIKADCFVVLDTNTLLVPYGTGKESLDQIRQTYATLTAGKRLIIPAQVAREFAKNRATKLSDLYKQLSDDRSRIHGLQLGSYPLFTAFDAYQKSLQLERQINPLIKEYQDQISTILEQIRNWNWDDPVSFLYNTLFNKDVVLEPPISQEDLRRDLARRQVHSIPPGYKDAAKDDEGIGDLLIWYTILEIGKIHKKSVIFVSGDEKADWWHQTNKQALYPRYELVDEFRRCSDGQSFHIIRLSRLLELFGASKHIVAEIKQEEVQVTLENRPVHQIRRRLLVEEAVFEWLNTNNPTSMITRFGSGQLIITNKDGTQTTVVIKYFNGVALEDLKETLELVLILSASSTASV
jgi:hypothetical protein